MFIKNHWCRVHIQGFGLILICRSYSICLFHTIIIKHPGELNTRQKVTWKANKQYVKIDVKQACILQLVDQDFDLVMNRRKC